MQPSWHLTLYRGIANDDDFLFIVLTGLLNQNGKLHQNQIPVRYRRRTVGVILTVMPISMKRKSDKTVNTLPLQLCGQVYFTFEYTVKVTRITK